MASRTVVIAGAGIGGLTAALALARHGFRALILEQAERLHDVGAGIQLSPNASSVLIGLGLGEALRKVAVTPEAIHVRRARTGDTIMRIPLGEALARRHGAPYWALHRGDLQAVLLAAAHAHPSINIELGAKVQTFASHANGVTVKAMRGLAPVDAQGAAFIGADGLWSAVRDGLGTSPPPRFARRVAWRALVPADMAPPEMRAPAVTMWLGARSHLVHYPVQGGRSINVVAIATDPWNEPGWSAASAPREVMARFPATQWSRFARDLLGIPERWQKWALFERATAEPWGLEQTTLVGDAAHPVLPFLAQGAALAIEDAAVVAARLADHPDDPAAGMRAYETERRKRVMQVQRAARRNGALYHYHGPDALVRDLVLRRIGGERVLNRYDWIYNWRPDAAGTYEAG